MSATILAFPANGAPGSRLLPTVSHLATVGVDYPPLISASADVSCGDTATTGSATALATKFVDHFLPVCQGSVDLLEADQADFEARCRRMVDADGTAMVDELCAEMEIVGRQMQILVDGLELTRGRLRTAVARLQLSLLR